MKDIKTLLLLVVSILLIIVSVFLMWTWTYRVKSITAIVEKKSGTVQVASTEVFNETNAAITDSLQRFYNSVLGNINRSIDSVRTSTDSLKGIDTKLSDFYKLRTEISDLLKTKLSDADIVVAKQKIIELQQRVAQLRIANTDIEQENLRLSSLVAQLTSFQKTVAAQNQSTDNRPVALRTVSNSADVSTSDIHLNAVMETEDNNETETVWAQQTDKFVGTFTVKNNSPQNSMIEMVVVVLQPDGKVLQKSTWETGTFDTKDGKKIYSYKLRADYNGGEAKRFQFSLSNDRYQKGNYTMQVYNKGVMIARVVKSLS